MSRLNDKCTILSNQRNEPDLNSRIYHPSVDWICAGAAGPAGRAGAVGSSRTLKQALSAPFAILLAGHAAAAPAPAPQAFSAWDQGAAASSGAPEISTDFYYPTSCPPPVNRKPQSPEPLRRLLGPSPARAEPPAPKPVARRSAPPAVAATRKAAARGNDAAPGDTLAESFHRNVWLDNSSIDNQGFSKAGKSQNERQSVSNLMSSYIFFFIP